MSKAYRIFPVTALVLLAASFLPFHQTIDLHVYDTYFVLNFPLLFRYAGLWFLLLYAFYKFFGRELYSLHLNAIHIVGTVACTCWWLWQEWQQTLPRQYMGRNNGNEIGAPVAPVSYAALLLLVILLLQLIPLLNLYLKLLRNKSL